MKKKYIAPKVEITFCYLEHSLLAGSDPSRNLKFRCRKDLNHP